jgi:predicted outer membrane repeat protein
MLEVRRLFSAIYVDVASPAATPNGWSWSTAYRDLRLALNASIAGDEIRVADGTYKPTTGTSRSFSFALKSGVFVRGGYAGYGAADPNARDVAAYVTMLSGDVGVAGEVNDNSYHVVTAIGASAATVLDGLTIRDGNAGGNLENLLGGGVYNVDGSPTFTRCIFTGNRGFNGAAMYNRGAASAPAVTDCTFTGNTATQLGGGAFSETRSAPRFTGCTFSNNAASSGGGGIDCQDSPATVTDCTFTGNSAYTGGALYNGSFAAPVTNCMFTNNTASYGGAITTTAAAPITGCTFTGNGASVRGGAISNFSGSSGITLTGCAFTRNTSTGPGGALYDDSSASLSINCTFNGNRAGTDGGAIGGEYAAPRLINCAVTGNTAGGNGGALAAGGVYSVSILLELINCTLAENPAAAGSGAIYVSSVSSANVRVTNCILRANTGSSAPQIFASPAVTLAVTYSDVQGGWSGAGNIDADPQFVRNPLAGGDGNWGTGDDDYGDLRLQIQSPCIDAANNAAVPATNTTDLAGGARVFDFPGVHDPGAIVDMGAHELGLRLGLLRVAAGSTLALPHGNRTFFVEQLDLGAGAKLDVGSNALCLDYSGASILGAWDGLVYTGVTGLIGSGRNSGAWDGSGIVTSMPDAADGLTTLGVAEASDLLGISTGETTTWNGHTVDATTVIVKYTYAGDANLDGVIDGGDYGVIDNFVQVPSASGYANGDFNYDGVVDGGDYGVIDNNIQAQGPTFPTIGSATASATLSGVPPVAEPASLTILALAAATRCGPALPPPAVHAQRREA